MVCTTLYLALTSLPDVSENVAMSNETQSLHTPLMERINKK